MKPGLLILSASLLALGVPVVADAQRRRAAPAAQQSAHDRLFQLFKDSDEASLKRNPLQALFRGDYRYADRLGDLFSDAHYQGEKAAAEHDLAALHTIPRGELSQTDQIAYDVFEYQTKDTLRALQPDLLTLTEALPINHFFGIHTQYPTIASGNGGAPYTTRRSTMRTASSATAISRRTSTRRSASGRRARRRASSTPSSPSATCSSSSTTS